MHASTLDQIPISRPKTFLSKEIHTGDSEEIESPIKTEDDEDLAFSTGGSISIGKNGRWVETKPNLVIRPVRVLQPVEETESEEERAKIG